MRLGKKFIFFDNVLIIYKLLVDMMKDLYRVKFKVFIGCLVVYLSKD